MSAIETRGRKIGKSGRAYVLSFCRNFSGQKLIPRADTPSQMAHKARPKNTFQGVLLSKVHAQWICYFRGVFCLVNQVEEPPFHINIPEILSRIGELWQVEFYKWFHSLFGAKWGLHTIFTQQSSHVKLFTSPSTLQEVV